MWRSDKKYGPDSHKDIDGVIHNAGTPVAGAGEAVEARENERERERERTSIRHVDLSHK